MNMKVLVAQSCLTLWDPMDYSPPSSSVHEILQTKILEWVSIPFPRGSSPPRDQTWVSCTAGRFFTIWASKEAHEHAAVLSYSRKDTMGISLEVQWLWLCAPNEGGTGSNPGRRTKILHSMAKKKRRRRKDTMSGTAQQVLLDWVCRSLLSFLRLCLVFVVSSLLN